MTENGQGKGSDNLCKQIEVCRNLKSQLMKEARDQYPFKESKESTVTADTIEKYVKILNRLRNLYKEEEKYWDELEK